MSEGIQRGLEIKDLRDLLCLPSKSELLDAWIGCGDAGLATCLIEIGVSVSIAGSWKLWGYNLV